MRQGKRNQSQANRADDAAAWMAMVINPCTSVVGSWVPDNVRTPGIRRNRITRPLNAVMEVVDIEMTAEGKTPVRLFAGTAKHRRWSASPVPGWVRCAPALSAATSARGRAEGGLGVYQFRGGCRRTAQRRFAAWGRRFLCNRGVVAPGRLRHRRPYLHARHTWMTCLMAGCWKMQDRPGRACRASSPRNNQARGRPGPPLSPLATLY